MKKLKIFLQGVLAILIYFILVNTQHIPFQIAGVDVNAIPQSIKSLYLILYEIFIVALMCLIFSKKLKKDFADILKNHKEYYTKCFKYYLIGLMIMLLSNYIISFIFKADLAANEEGVRNLFKISPLYVYLASVIFAPIVEELTFRQGIRNIFGRNYFFVFISGIVFGALHVVPGAENIKDLLYIIPYSSLGIVLAYMLYKTENIFVSMGFHFMHNGVLIALQFLSLLF